MFKPLWILSVSFILVNISFAQTFSYQPKSTVPGAKSAGGLLPVLSPDDYRKAVSQSTQENKSTLSQEVSKSLSKVQPIMPPPEPPQTESSVTTPATTTVTTKIPTTATPTKDTSVQSVQTVSPIQSYPQNSGNNTKVPTYPNQPNNTVPTYPNQQQTQVYTGFQAQPPAGTTTSTPGKTMQQQPPSSGGWNIKY